MFKKDLEKRLNLKGNSKTNRVMMVEELRDTSIRCNQTKRYWHKEWIEEVSDTFYDREKQITIDESEKQKMSIHKSIIEHFTEHARTTIQSNNALQQINFIRI